MANPPEGLTSAGCAPKFPPGCDCEYCWSPHYQAGQLTPCSGDPEASAEDSTCSADESCVQCKCLPLGCDCDPDAEDPNSFCPSGDVCKVITSAHSPALVNTFHICPRIVSASPRSRPGVTVTPALMTLMRAALPAMSVSSACVCPGAVTATPAPRTQTASVPPEKSAETEINKENNRHCSGVTSVSAGALCPPAVSVTRSLMTQTSSVLETSG